MKYYLGSKHATDSILRPYVR